MTVSTAVSSSFTSTSCYSTTTATMTKMLKWRPRRITISRVIISVLLLSSLLVLVQLHEATYYDKLSTLSLSLSSSSYNIADWLLVQQAATVTRTRTPTKRKDGLDGKPTISSISSSSLSSSSSSLLSFSSSFVASVNDTVQNSEPDGGTNQLTKTASDNNKKEEHHVKIAIIKNNSHNKKSIDDDKELWRKVQQTPTTTFSSSSSLLHGHYPLIDDGSSWNPFYQGKKANGDDDVDLSAAAYPYSVMAPHLNVIWSRGWYNAHFPEPSTVPLWYYNTKEMSKKNRKNYTNPYELTQNHMAQFWNMTRLCHRRRHNNNNNNNNNNNIDSGNNGIADKHLYLWLRTPTVDRFALHIEQEYQQQRIPDVCNISIITSDGDGDVPMSYPNAVRILLEQANSTGRFLHKWYSPNIVPITTINTKTNSNTNTTNQLSLQQLQQRHNQIMVPIPLGLDLHGINKNMPYARNTLQYTKIMASVRQNHYKPFHQREKGNNNNKSDILVDVGALKHCPRRAQFRLPLAKTIAACGMQQMAKQSIQSAWKTYAKHQFAVAPVGCAWDTHRLWEFLFFGTVPIVISTAPASYMDALLLKTHVPVIIVKDWNEVCTLQHNATLYHAMVQRYQYWIARAHEWLRPDVWVPHNQTRFEELCDALPGCREAEQVQHRMV